MQSSEFSCARFPGVRRRWRAAAAWTRWGLGLALGVRISGGVALSADAADYIMERWQVDEGLPQTSVTSIAQTPDGYLWLGTFNGLARFDGMRFVVFDEGNTPALGSSRIIQLRTDVHDGGLWIVTEPGGLARLVGGKCFRYGPEQGVPAVGIHALAQDSDGALRLVDRLGGLHQVARSHIVPLESAASRGTPDEPRLLFADNGACWVVRQGKATASALAPLRIPSAAGPQPSVTELRIVCATPGCDGGYWLATTSGVYRLKGGQPPAAIGTFPEPLGDLKVILEDASGDFLLGSWSRGLIRWNPAGRWECFKPGTDSSGATLMALFRDREGMLWVGTGNRGLYRLRRRLFRMYDTRDGLPADAVTSLCADRTGRVWIGVNGGGLNCWEDGRLTRMTDPPELGRYPLVYSVLADRKDAVWIGLYGRTVLRLQNGVLTTHFLAPEEFTATPRVLFEDQAGAVWLGTERGLHRHQGARFTRYTRQEGLSHDDVRALTEDRRGTLYIGTGGGGLNVLRAGQFTQYTERDGLADNHIAALWVDREDTLWIGTVNGGLSRFKHGRFVNITVRDGLPSNTIGTLLEDESGDLWLGSNRGILRLRKELANEYAEGRRHDLQCQVFNRSDGLNTVECVGGGQPASWKTADGRLWFSTANGVAVVDPKHLPSNPLPPSVVIEEVVLDDEVHDLQHAVSVTQHPGSKQAREQRHLPHAPRRASVFTVPAGIQRVEFRFTGLSLEAPEKVRFRYQLEGLDDDWIEAGLRRTAHYTRLPSGRYRFRVTACNGDGVWNESGVALPVDIVPVWWQAGWARAAALGAVAGLACWSVEARVRRLKRRRAAQDAFSQRLLDSQEAERKRIAAELHDSLGQNLLVIKNRALLGLQHAADTAPAVEQFDEISRMASHTLEEVREISRNLRPHQLDRLGLTKALQSMAAEVSRASGILISIDFDSLDRLLPPSLEIHLFRIVQELLNNIVKHSRASNARVAARLRAHQITLTIEDDGCGFDAERLSAGSEHRGLGLSGIHERVCLLRGAARCDSRQAGGTRWAIDIPVAPGTPADGTAGSPTIAAT